MTKIELTLDQLQAVSGGCVITKRGFIQVPKLLCFISELDFAIPQLSESINLGVGQVKYPGFTPIQSVNGEN